MTDLLAAVGILLGAGFVLVAAIGVLRMPDLYTRMHAATKAGALGAGLLVLSVAVAIGDAAFTGRAVATVVFVVLTAPVAAHALGRAHYRSGQ